MSSTLAVLASINWTLVLVALIGAVPATIAAVASLHTRSAVRTPSKTSIGKQVEDALQTVIANNFRLQSLGNAFDAPMPAKAAQVEAKVVALNEIQTRAERAAGKGA